MLAGTHSWAQQHSSASQGGLTGPSLPPSCLRHQSATDMLLSRRRPPLSQVLGKVPNIILEGIQATDREDLERQERATAAAAAAAAPPSFSSPASASAATVSFAQLAGRSGQVSFERPIVSSTSSPASAEAAAILPGVGLPPPLPEIKLDDETLLAVSRAIMGRLDVVDLVGRTTAYEAAERVRRAEGPAPLLEKMRCCLGVIRIVPPRATGHTHTRLTSGHPAATHLPCVAISMPSASPSPPSCRCAMPC